MTVKYTTAAIVSDLLAGITCTASTAKIEEVINQNEAFIDGLLFRDLAFTFSSVKNAHLIIRKICTLLSAMDLALANLSGNTIDQIKTFFDGCNAQYDELIKPLQEEGGMISWIKKQ